MESGIVSDMIRCCDCGCDCSLKRRHDESSSSNAKVQIENECQLLRETVTTQQESIQDLYAELDEERNAASTAANEAMSMILRLQREKAEVEMELRQFKRFSQDKMEHDQQELLALEDLVYKKEQTIQALTFEAQAYRHRMMSYGVSEAEVDDQEVKNMYNEYDYPPLKCNLNENPEPLEADDVDVDVDKYTLTHSPLKSLEQRISQMERVPSFGDARGSPRRQRHFRRVSTGSSSSLLGTNRDQKPHFSVDSPRGSFKAKGGSSETGYNDMDDRVYTIDSVHQGVSDQKVRDDTADGYGEELNQPDLGDPDIVKLHARLQALEADRESMRHAIVSMRTEKAQMVLLKEIAQHLSKDVIPERRLPLKKASIVGVFSFLSVFKWITSFVFWRKKARRSKYMNGVQGNNVGLEMLVEKTPRIRQWRCLSSTQV